MNQQTRWDWKRMKAEADVLNTSRLSLRPATRTIYGFFLRYARGTTVHECVGEQSPVDARYRDAAPTTVHSPGPQEWN